ncbi:MAG TPA: tRNA lysidine(34) synthetase TilS [Gemmatimonadaceae bacterium]|nr:tRNA lysidine(34) synthetase TilS [Gemmatimonadaceae bacterium]
MPTVELPNARASLDPRAASPVERAAAEAAQVAHARGERLLLAVSGGRDSMVLLDAMARVAPQLLTGVATFDHGTGAAASAAVALVQSECERLGISVRIGRAELAHATEAEWRAARWRFLRDTAQSVGARIATAHTRADNIETILMRVMRGAGARGLAALYAPGDVVRPLLEVDRAAVASYAAGRGVRWIEDPSNASPRFFRNRVRTVLLPALLAQRPALADELLDLARRAATLRRRAGAVVDEMSVRRKGNALVVAAADLADYDPESLRFLWGEIAARAGVVLDARGTAGLAGFTKSAATGDRMQLSGAVEVLRRRDAIVLRPPDGGEAPPAVALGAAGSTEWGSWRFRAVDPEAVGREGAGDAWSARFPNATQLIVREWRPGDRMQGAGDAAPRRVKRFLRDAGLVGPERAGWPVVLDGEMIVWIPGVRRSDAATVRSGRPEAVYVCERIEQRES